MNRALVVLLALAVSLPAATDAQQRGPRGEVDRAQLEQRIRAQMGRMMRERLGLEEQQAARLADVVQDFDGRRRELFTREQATRRRLEAFLLEGGDNDEEARALMQRMAELRRQEADLFAAEQDALLEVLSPAQVLQLQRLRQELGQRIRRIRGGRGGDGAPSRRTPGPGAFRGGDAPAWPGLPAPGWLERGILL